MNFGSVLTTITHLADIRFLLQLPGVDHREVREYFERHGLEDRFDDIQKSGAVRAVRIAVRLHGCG